MLSNLRWRISALSITKRVIAIFLGVAIVMTVLFIFSNSMKTPEASTSDSNAVKDLVSQVIPPESDLGQTILKNIRKIAHFTEYGLLGIEVSALLFVLTERKRRLPLRAFSSLLFALTVGFLDESIQIVSKRGPMIRDVWIDVGGFFTYSLLTFGALVGIFYLLRLIKRKRSN